MIKNSPVLLPREKALQFGTDSLTDKELLAILIESGGKDNSVFDIADNLLKTFGSLSLLSKVNYRDLSAIKGLKNSKCLKLLVAFEIHNRLISSSYQLNDTLDSLDKIYTRYKYLEDYEQEVLVLVMLNRRKRILKEKTLYKGTSVGLKASLKEIIGEALISKCSSFIIIHNHVLGSENKPSVEDEIFTRVIQNEANNLGITMLDHIIIYQGGYYSFNSQNKD